MEAASTAVPAQLPQHMQALAHANEIRLARAALKRAINAGNESAADVVRDLRAETRAGLARLLRSQRRWGRTRVRKFLIPLAVNENRELGRLTLRQRDELAKRLMAMSVR